ncbi:hypothetical protein TcWFU_010458 [Taenia crassiceps]|uniref:Protein SHQ1 homolog n=1 Tax=Taenia crassiceps TaxID=6207 RepID=A0ABR4Q1W6_9CEST
MLTPLFSLTQTSDNLTLKLHIPLADLSNSEFLVEDGVVYFGAPPYYLRLELPGSVVEDDDHIQFRLIINPAPRKTVPKAGIQVLDSTTALPEGKVEYDWFVELPEEANNDNSTDDDHINVEIIMYPYGFAASKSGLFADKPETCLPIDLPNPDFCSPLKRHKLQLQSVRDHFQAEHYVADYYEAEVSANALRQLTPWVENKTRDVHPSEKIKVENTRTFVYLGLVDLLLAYTYDYRVREGDENCESGWVIVKIASTLSWLELFPNLPTLLRSFYERTLSFPLIRNWKLCRKVQADVASLLQHKNAKAWILYILLEIRRMLIDYPGYYIFVDLFMDDYIVWLQKSASTYVLKHLGEAIGSVKLKKADVNLPLKEIERIAAEALEEEAALADNLGSISLNS